MKLSSKTRLALNAVLDVVVNGGTDPVSMPTLAERQGISVSYLEALFSGLRRAGVIVAIRGPGGGYQVVRPLASITLLEISQAIEDRLDPEECGGAANCYLGTRCLAHNAWQLLSDRVDNLLATISLADVLRMNGQEATPATRRVKAQATGTRGIKIMHQATQPATVSAPPRRKRNEAPSPSAAKTTTGGNNVSRGRNKPPASAATRRSKPKKPSAQ